MTRVQVLVGGFDPDEIYNHGREKAAKQREEEAARGREDSSSGGNASAFPSPAGEFPSSHGPPDPLALRIPGVKFGRFSVGDIRPHAQGFEFIDLKLPVGDCKRLLVRKEYCLGGEKRTLDGWFEYNRKPFNRAGSDSLTNVMPLWLRYALMAASYQVRGLTRFDQVLEGLNAIWQKDASEEYPFDTTQAVHNPGACPMVIHYGAFPTGHPFSKEIPDAYEYGIGTKFHAGGIRALESLIYEDDPDRARRVLMWALGEDTAEPWIIRGPISDPCATACQIGMYAKEGIDNGFPAISAMYRTIDKPRRARGYKIELDDLEGLDRIPRGLW